MEDILKKREQKFIEEGLFIIGSFEKYTSKNKPDIYKKYIERKEKRFIYNNSYQWGVYKRNIEYIKKNYNYKYSSEDIIKEIEIYINSIKPKIFFKREDIYKIYQDVMIIKEFSDIFSITKINYCIKLKNFLTLRRFLLDFEYTIKKQKED